MRHGLVHKSTYVITVHAGTMSLALILCVGGTGLEPQATCIPALILCPRAEYPAPACALYAPHVFMLHHAGQRHHRLACLVWYTKFSQLSPEQPGALGDGQRVSRCPVALSEKVHSGVDTSTFIKVLMRRRIKANTRISVHMFLL